jgi:hypothetical protein
LIKSMVANVHAAIRHVKAAAQQLPKLGCWITLRARICQRIVGQSSLPVPPLTLAAPGQMLFLGSDHLPGCQAQAAGLIGLTCPRRSGPTAGPKRARGAQAQARRPTRVKPPRRPDRRAVIRRPA